MGVLIEHFAGAFPVWLAPIQAKVIPVAEAFNDYAETIKQQLQQGIMPTIGVWQHGQVRPNVGTCVAHLGDELRYRRGGLVRHIVSMRGHDYLIPLFCTLRWYVIALLIRDYLIPIHTMC